MTRTSYIALTDVTITHEYFESKPIDYLRIIPDKRSQTFIWNRSLLFKQTSNGFALYRSDEFDAEETRDLIDFVGDYFIRFELYSKYPTFANFTRMPMDKLAIFSFSNARLVPGSDYELMPKFTWDPFVIGQVATIDLHLGAFLSEDDQFEHKAYQVSFSSRLTQRNYFLMNVIDHAYKGLSITDSKGEQLGLPIPSRLQNGSEAILISSGDRLFPLAQNPKEHFSLIKRPSSEWIKDGDETEGQVLIERLPGADSSIIQTSRNTKGDPIAASNIYIYL